MPAHDLTITALWTVNEYEVSFDFKNGTTDKETVKYGEPINYPEGIEREGYKFNGWKPNPRTMPVNDLVTKAQWGEEIRFVEISLGTADLSESEVIDLIKKQTDADFTIDRLEIDESSGSTQIIIRFEDPEDADKFIDKVKEEINRGGDTYFRNVTPLHRATPSYSHGFYPFSLLSFSLFLWLYIF